MSDIPTASRQSDIGIGLDQAMVLAATVGTAKQIPDDIEAGKFFVVRAK
jgi:hypothetical protein